MENIKSNFAFLCDMAFFSEGGKLNIIGVFKNIFGHKLPIVHPQMYIVSSVSIKGDGNYEEVVKIIKLKDNVEIVSPLKFNLAVKGGQGAEFGIIGQLANIKFEEAGQYEIQIFINDEMIKKIPFSITIK